MEKLCVMQQRQNWLEEILQTNQTGGKSQLRTQQAICMRKVAHCQQCNSSEKDVSNENFTRGIQIACKKDSQISATLSKEETTYETSSPDKN